MKYADAALILREGSKALEYQTTLRFRAEDEACILAYRGMDIMEWFPDGSVSLSAESAFRYGPNSREMIRKRLNKYVPLGWRVVVLGNPASIRREDAIWNLKLHRSWESGDPEFWLFYDGIVLLDDDVVSLPF